jgi:hypothetical protein
MAFSAPLRTRIESEPRRPATTVECALSEQVRAPGSSRIESATCADQVRPGLSSSIGKVSTAGLAIFDADEHTGIVTRSI